MNLKVSALAGLVLGLVVVVWQFVSIGFGLTAVFVPVATLLQLIVLISALVRTRAAHGYLQQVVAGTALSAVASVLIACGSVVALTWVFPDVLGELSLGPQVAAGVVGTLATGVVASAVAAIWLR